MRGTPRAKISVWRVAEAMVDFAKPQHETLEERLRGLGMHIMFVCTGNICRSPMGELLMTHYLNGTTGIAPFVCSAATQNMLNSRPCGSAMSFGWGIIGRIIEDFLITD